MYSFNGRLISVFLVFVASVHVTAQPTDVFFEPFDNNNNGWSLFEQPYAKSKIVSGAMYMDATDEGIGFFNQMHHQIDPGKDFLIKAVLEVRNFRNGSFGLVWGADEYSNYQAFDFSNSGFYHIYIFKRKKVVPIHRPDFLPTPLEEGRKYELVVKKTGQEISFELNGRQLAKAPFVSFQGTYLGFHLRGRVSVKVYELSVLQEKEDIRIADGVLTTRVKENMGPRINSEYSEKGVVVSPDGSTLYVARGEHPMNTGTGKKDDIWYSQKDSLGEWDYLQNIGAPLNNAGNNFVVSVAPDGNNLLVANTYLPDGRTLGGGVSLTRRTATGWERPKNLEIDDYYNEADFVDYCLSPNQKVLVMAVERKDTKGDMDLYCSFLNDNNSWSAPTHLGPVVNSYAMDFSPFVAPDNETLYFSSYGHPGYGSADIFVSRRLDDSWTNWSVPENLGPEVNTSTWEANYTLDARGEYAYLASAEGSMGLSDIFRIAMPSATRPRPVVLISGIVLDASTGLPIEAQIRYFSLQQGEEDLGIASSHPVTGRYTIILPAGENYGFHADKSGFYPESANLNTLGLDTYTELKQDLLLSPLNVGASVTLNNLFFDVNQSVLQKESLPELERLVKLLETHPGMEIEIAGHTDNSGASDYNLTLSNDRSRAVLAYLSERGFGSRANAVGYGATKPKTSNDSEEGRRLNRRVEIVILKL